MILDMPLLLETRRNHAVEHATLHILARKYKNMTMGGHSNPTGFYLMGNFTKDDIMTAAAEAMERVRAGWARVVAAVPRVAMPCWEVDLAGPTVLVVGS